MRSVVFLDLNKNIVLVEVRFGDYISFSGECGGIGQIIDHISPASPNQENLVRLWKEYHLKPVTEEAKKEVMQAVEAVCAEVDKREAEFLENLGERELWKYLRDEVDATDADVDICQRVHAIFDAMEWPYHFATQVDFCTGDFSSIEVGGFSFYCDKEVDMRDIAISYLNDTGLELWKGAVQCDKTEKGFEDWCEDICDWGNWTEVLDGYDGVGQEFEVDGTTYWVGRR